MAQIPSMHSSNDITLKRGVISSDTEGTSGPATADPEWKYLPVRRIADALEDDLQDGLTWAVFGSDGANDAGAIDAFVFEPNDAPLWHMSEPDVSDSLDRFSNAEMGHSLDAAPHRFDPYKTFKFQVAVEDPEPPIYSDTLDWVA